MGSSQLGNSDRKLLFRQTWQNIVFKFKESDKGVDLVDSLIVSAIFETLNTLQIKNVWVTSLGFGYNFWGKQDECLETDKFGQMAYSLFRRGREFQQQQQAIWIL